MVKNKTTSYTPRLSIGFGRVVASQKAVKHQKKKLKEATEDRAFMRTEKNVEKAHKEIQRATHNIKVTKEIRKREIKRVASRIGQKIASKARQVGDAKALNRKVLRKGPRPVLDLRRRLDREEPVKQHGFKEGEIGNGGLL